MKVRFCDEKDIVKVGEFYDKVVLHLCQTTNYPKGKYKVYPSEASVREKIVLNQQFVCMDEDNIVGAFVLNDDPQGMYENADWTIELLQNPSSFWNKKKPCCPKTARLDLWILGYRQI